jgi:hypothetical protein
MWRPRDRERYIGGYDPEHEMPDPDRHSGGRWQSDAYRHNARDTRFAYRLNPDRFERQFDRNAPQRWDAGDSRDRGYGYDRDYGRDYGRDNYGRSNYGPDDYGRSDHGRDHYDRGNYAGYRNSAGENRPGYGFERDDSRGGYGSGGGSGRGNYSGADRGWDRFSPNQHYDRWSADRGADHDYWTTRGGRTPFDDDRDRDRGYGRNFDWDDDWRRRR